MKSKEGVRMRNTPPYATCLTARPHPSDVKRTLVSVRLNISETLDAYIPLLSNSSFMSVPWVPLF